MTCTLFIFFLGLSMSAKYCRSKFEKLADERKNIFFSRNKHQHDLHVWTFLFTLNYFVTFI